MYKISLVDRITALSEPLLASLGLSLWGVEYLPSGGRAVLRIYIEKALAEIDYSCGEAQTGEANISDCSEASRLIGLSLDVEDIIPSAYVLEVSTPGLERRFFKPAQLAAVQGQPVEIILLETAGELSGRKKYAGTIISVRVLEQDWLFTLQTPAPDSVSLEFLWSGVKKARQIYIEPPKIKPGSKVGKIGRKAGSGQKDENGGQSK